MEAPLLVVNLKAYPGAVGDGALRILEALERVQRETGVAVAIAPNHVDLSALASRTSIPVLAQGAVPGKGGARTAKVPIGILPSIGVEGLIINHSENPQSLAEISKLVEEGRELGLWTLVCVPSPAEAMAVASLSPDAIAVEPPDLIGGPISVSRARPEALLQFSRVLSGTYTGLLLAGAGISTGEDSRRARELGMDGVLVASAIAASGEPFKRALDIATGLLGHDQS
ncbi:MAG: triosephosphate isomerase [Thermoplasmata archaeon]|nr:triosephosphate isomerase [Thermoplasmata archaeon]